MASEWEEINKTRTEKVTQKKFIKISKSLGRKWNKMSDTLKQKFKKSKPKAVEPETKPADIQPEKEAVIQNQPESIVESPTEVQPKPTTEEESSVKPEVTKDGSELVSEPSELSDLIGRSNVGSAINLPKTADPEPAEEEIQEQEASEENAVDAVDEVVADGTTDEIIADGSVIEEATSQGNAVAEDADTEEKAAAEEVDTEEKAAAEEVVAEEIDAEPTVVEPSADQTVTEDVSEENTLDQDVIEAPDAVENSEVATEDVNVDAEQAIVNLNEVKSDGNQQIKSELQDQIDITEPQAAEVSVDSSQGEGIPATD